jgi:dTDP-4-dehydrorhamnose reductase
LVIIEPLWATGSHPRADFRLAAGGWKVGGRMTKCEILVIGSSGQLGRELLRGPWPDQLMPRPIDRAKLDLADSESINSAISALKPALVINAAAYTDVDQAEVYPQVAQTINCDWPSFLALVCGQLKIPLIHISSDYVFDGNADRPYRETDECKPINTYGESKAAAERNISRQTPYSTILRTSWLFSAHRENFVTKILRAATKGQQLNVVDDQTGSPTYAAQLGRAIIHIVPRCLDRDPAVFDLFNVAGSGTATWFDIAQQIFACAPASIRERCVLKRISTSEFPSRAARPKYSVLDNSLAARRLGLELEPWRYGVKACIDEIGSRST